MRVSYSGPLTTWKRVKRVGETRSKEHDTQQPRGTTSLDDSALDLDGNIFRMPEDHALEVKKIVLRLRFSFFVLIVLHRHFCILSTIHDQTSMLST